MGTILEALEYGVDSRMRGRVIRITARLGVALLCLTEFGLGAELQHSRGESTRFSTQIVRPHSAGAPFAIADLDGDQKPDVALVELGGKPSAKTSYSIRLQLSAGPESAVGVSGPIGGLQVAARDVNGDASIDLIITSNLDSSFVEVLLNDGHGGFSPAEPGTYRELQEQPHALVNGANGPSASQSSLELTRSSLGQEGVAGYYQTVLASDLFPFLEERTALRKLTHSRLGRSPPVPVSLS